jgi:hypothetical protein
MHQQLHLVVDEQVPRNMRASSEEIVAAYKETGSVWKAGKMLGMPGQTVHERLRLLGHPMLHRNWTDDEIAELRELLSNGVTLGEAALRLGRPYAGVAVKASRLGMSTARQAQRKVPRGAGYDKESMRKHLLMLERFAGTATQYARANGLNIDSVVYAMQNHFPERWEAYVRAHARIPKRRCEYCEVEFYPSNGKQRFHSRQCASHAKTDRDYFGGKRKNTIGLSTGICQLCCQKKKVLHSHHILGKDNDPRNDALLALCAGCHQLVGRLAARKFLDDAVGWERLISLAWMRRNPDGLKPGEALYVEVRIEAEQEENDLAA